MLDASQQHKGQLFIHAVKVGLLLHQPHARKIAFKIVVNMFDQEQGDSAT